MGPPYPIQPPAVYSSLDAIRAFRQVVLHAKKFVFTETGTQMFMGAAFRLIIARRWKNPNIHQLMKEKQNGVYPDNGMLFAYKKKRRSDICHKMDESKRKKPVTKDHV